MSAIPPRADVPAATSETRRIALSLITPVQMREETSDQIVRLYAADMKRPTQVFPPIVVFSDGEHYWLADGMHRTLAAQTLGLPDIEARILPGGEREAVEYAALEAPKDHSKVAYGEGDKQLRVKRMWETHPEWHHGGASNVMIAHSCGVSEYTVRQARQRYGLTEISSLHNEDISPPSPDMPLPPAVNVTRTSKLGKTTTYQQRQPVRAARPQEQEMPMALDVVSAPADEAEGDTSGGDPFLGMKLNTVIHLMADFHKRAVAAIGSDVPDRAMLDAWWEGVEPREWQAFQEYLPWLRAFGTALNNYITTYHRNSGQTTTPPMVKQLAPKTFGGKK